MSTVQHIARIGGSRPRSDSDRQTGGFLPRISGAVTFVLCLLVGIALVLTLITYSPNDPGFSHVSSSDTVTNLLGVQGAWVADFTLLLFGRGVWVAVAGGVVILLQSWQKLWGKREEEHSPLGLRLVALCVLIVAASALAYLRLHSSSHMLPATSGGMIGSTVGTLLMNLAGFNLSTLILTVVAALSLSLFFNFSWLAVFEGIGSFLEFIFTRLRNRRERQDDEEFGRVAKDDRKKSREEMADVPLTPHAEAPIEVKQEAAEEAAPASIFFTDEKKEENQDPLPCTMIAPGVLETTPAAAAPAARPAEAAPAAAPVRKAEAAPAPAAAAAEEARREIPIEPMETFNPPFDADPQTEDEPEAPRYTDFHLPEAQLLDEPPYDRPQVTQEELQSVSSRIEYILGNYRIKAKVVSAMPGPVITQFKVQPGEGVSGRRFVSVAKDLARGLGQPSLRVVENLREADCIGLEVPNGVAQTIYLKEIIGSRTFASSPSKLTLALGKGISGEPVITNLAKAPHLLVAGTTGSGKSIGINAMILSMLYKSRPDELRLILVDPKEVEFAPYENIPHLLTPVVTDMMKAVHALDWCVKEMDRRYNLMKRVGVKTFDAFNEKIEEERAKGLFLPNPLSLTPENPEPLEKFYYIVIIIDELADLLLVHGKQVEPKIMRLTQKARAAGMHMILATQRPSTDIVTPIIKTNCPTRISFQVSNRYDSATILGDAGAEDLLGRGDMFFMQAGQPLQRVHGAYVDDKEIKRVTDYLRSQAEPNFVDGVTEPTEEEELAEALATPSPSGGEGDSFYDQAVSIVLTERKCSISYLQRRLGVGYNRAANLVEAMEKAGIVSSPTATGKREVLAPSSQVLD
jgi:S-DNA-T family DNA segregation ATPase FtsK/SpoIIIE